jgi:hypothetical protein
LAVTVMTLYCSPRSRTGKGRGPEGSGLYPELAAYEISEGCSPNVQSEVGRLVGLLPIEQARVELARRGLETDEKAIRRIAGELGAQMLATRTRDLMRFRAGELPAGKEFAGKSIAAEIDGGRVRVRTIVKKIRVSGKMKRKKFRVEWREPKVVILFELDSRYAYCSPCRKCYRSSGPALMLKLRTEFPGFLVTIADSHQKLICWWPVDLGRRAA